MVFPADLRQLVVLEHWHPVLFQVADSAPSLVPNPEHGLVSSLVLLPVPNLCLWAVQADSNFLVQTIAAAYPDLVYRNRGRVVPASYSCPSLGESYFCERNLYHLYPVFQDLRFGNLCRPCRQEVHAASSCPDVQSLDLYLGNPG